MKVKLVVFIALILLLIGCNHNTGNRKEGHNRVISAIDSIFMQLQVDEIFNGELLIAQNQKIIIHRHYGLANLRSKDEFTNESVFELASVSKPFTALAIAKLVAEKKIIV